MSQQAMLDAFHNLATDEPEVLQAVYEKVADRCREGLLLQFVRKGLILTANPDDDTLDARSTDVKPLDASWALIDEELWSSLLGTTFGWGWITINQQGYCDGALLSFDGLEPTVLLNVTGSSIRVRRIVPERRVAPVIS